MKLPISPMDQMRAKNWCDRLTEMGRYPERYDARMLELGLNAEDALFFRRYVIEGLRLPQVRHEFAKDQINRTPGSGTPWRGLQPLVSKFVSFWRAASPNDFPLGTPLSTAPTYKECRAVRRLYNALPGVLADESFALKPEFLAWLDRESLTLGAHGRTWLFHLALKQAALGDLPEVLRNLPVGDYTLGLTQFRDFWRNADLETFNCDSLIPAAVSRLAPTWYERSGEPEVDYEVQGPVGKFRLRIKPRLYHLWQRERLDWVALPYFLHYFVERLRLIQLRGAYSKPALVGRISLAVTVVKDWFEVLDPGVFGEP